MTKQRDAAMFVPHAAARLVGCIESPALAALVRGGGVRVFALGALGFDFGLGWHTEGRSRHHESEHEQDCPEHDDQNDGQNIIKAHGA
jgi:hypothetical protein